jgi:hypothetical protein
MSNVDARLWLTTSASNCPATGARMIATPPQPQLSSFAGRATARLAHLDDDGVGHTKARQVIGCAGADDHDICGSHRWLPRWR